MRGGEEATAEAGRSIPSGAATLSGLEKESRLSWTAAF
jgi:hypothetical protein